MKRVFLGCFITVTLFIVALSLGSIHVQAQLDTDELQASESDDTLSLSANPPYPQPKQAITVHVQSLKMDLDRSTITWYVNGQKTKQGIGMTSMETTANTAGSPLIIAVEAENAAGRRALKSLTINSASVDILWEAQSYTPPFYKGKALLPYQGTFVVTAMPNLVEKGIKLSSKNLVYTWAANGEPLKGSSGYGKDSATLTAGILLQPLQITVEVTSLSGKTTATGSTIIEARAPELVLYEDSPLYGPLYHRAFGSTLSLKNKEIWLRATPYYFSTPRFNPTVLSYNWNINNNAAADTKDTIILRQPGTVSGKSVVTVKTNVNDRPLQASTKTTEITFTPQ
jgi:hypothetical protein